MVGTDKGAGILFSQPLFGLIPSAAIRLFATPTTANSLFDLEQFVERVATIPSPASNFSRSGTMRRLVVMGSVVLSLIATQTPCEASGEAGSWLCDQVNRPHDPKPVRNWLRGFVAASGFTGDYQYAAGQVGTLCQQHPDWTLSDAANYWKQSLEQEPSGSGNNNSINQQQIQQKQIIINVNPTIQQ